MENQISGLTKDREAAKVSAAEAAKVSAAEASAEQRVNKRSQPFKLLIYESWVYYIVQPHALLNFVFNL